MTNTVHIPTEIEAKLTGALTTARRIHLSKSYVAEAEAQGLAPDDAFCGVDAVRLVEGSDTVLTFEVLDWTAATVRVALERVVADEDDFRTETDWQLTLTEAPLMVFTDVLRAAWREQDRQTNS